MEPDRPLREHLMLRRHRAAIGGAAFLYSGAVAILILMTVPPARAALDAVDQRVFDFVAGHRAGWLGPPAELLNWLGSAWVTAPLRVAVSLWLLARRRYEAMWAWMGAIVVSEIAVGVLKSVYGRARPPDALVATTGASFPSGHATAGAVVAIGLVIVLVPAGRRRLRWEVAAGTFAFVMGASRVYLNAHWLTDVVVGTLLGAALAVGVAGLVHEFGDRLYRRRIRSRLPTSH